MIEAISNGAQGNSSAISSGPFACRICGGTAGASHRASEKMFGTGDSFDYFECNDCRCLQIMEVPADLGRYYPSHYYSFAAPAEADGGTRGAIRELLLRMVLRAPTRLREKALLELPWYRLGATQASLQMALLAKHRHARILDVGAGGGRLVRSLAHMGFVNALGIDPFIAGDVMEGGRCLVRKADIYAIDQPFDLIMMHHALEHMDDHLPILRHARSILDRSGVLLIRVPVADCHCWRHYGTDWVQLDAPRHLILHSRDSLERLASQAGLAVAGIRYDSTSFQFSGSELYRRGIPLIDAEGRSNHTAKFLSPEMLEDFARRARELNAAQDGDQLCIFLRHG